MHKTSGMRVLLKIRGRKVNLLLLARGRSLRLLLYKDFRDGAATTKAKARVNYFQVVDISRLIASLGRGYVTIAISLDT